MGDEECPNEVNKYEVMNEGVSRDGLKGVQQKVQGAHEGEMPAGC